MSQVDEFGRAIQGGGSDSDPPAPPHYAGGSGGPPHHHHREQRGLLAPRGRYNPNEHHYPPHHGPHHGGPPPLGPHWTRGGRGGGVGGGPPSRRGPPPLLKGVGDSSVGPGATAGVPTAARPQSPSSSSVSSSQPLPHPSQRYVGDPMLCGFLWKEQQQEKQTQGKGGDNNDTNDDEKGEDDEEDETQKMPAADSEDGKGGGENKSNTKSYDDYRLEYAWTFLKHFFNQHLDDSWFRQSYSPALLVEGAQLERRRCHEEARFLRQELSGNSDMTGFGLTASSSTVSLTAHLGHLPSTKGRILHFRNVPPHVTDEHIRQALLPSLTDVVLAQIQEQMKQPGNKKRADKKINPSHQEVLEQTLLGVFSSTPYNTNTLPTLATATAPANTMSNTRILGAPRGGSVFLHRNVFCVLMTDKIMNSLWQLLTQRDSTPEEASPASAPAASVDVHVPRKQDEKAATALASKYNNSSLLDLDIDCTDPYGRTEYDANGRGGPPPDGLAVPPRKAVVQLCRYDVVANTSTLKLSAALSSPTRFAGDHEAAQTIARALDVRHHVPIQDRLHSILEQIMNSGQNAISNLLDVSLAYLRRVHLYSFYKTTKAESFGDMLSGRSAAAQVQLRDEPIDGDGDFKDDILGQRLNDSIRQTLEVDCQKWIAAADCYVDEKTDAAAKEIQELEESATEDWLHKHFMDDDGRARCSFHFCHKLFKDESFLSKHLLKKHVAYNNAERAKCHDKYMMTTWENAPVRPAVPLILVDCGKQFGKQEAALSGGPEPRATDPEPALWDQKQYQEKLLLERQELRAKRPIHAMGHGDRGGPAPPMGGPRPHKQAFVDVDDMKEETVQVSFDQVQLPPPPTSTGKKKKKKRKLL